MFINLCHDERLDQTETLTYTIPLDDPKADLVVLDAIERWRDRQFRVVSIEDERDGTEGTKVVECEALWYDLGRLTKVGALVLDAVTPASGLETLLTDTGWTVGGLTTAAVTTFSMEGQDKTVLELLRKWAKITGTHLRFDTIAQTVDLAETQGRDLGGGFRYGRNLQRILRRREAPICTVLYPYGQDGLTIAGVNAGAPYLEDFSFYTAQGLTTNEARTLHTKRRVWSDTSFLVDTDLLAAAEAKLVKLAQPVIAYECKVVDLSELTGISEAVMAPGDSLRVSDPDIGVDLDAVIVRLERYPLEPWRNEVELAFLPDTFDDPDSDSSRSDQSEDWHQFIGPVKGDYQIRNDGRYITNRIPLRFRTGGKAHYHLDLRATGVGDGVMHVDIYDNENASTVFRSLDVAYTDGNEVQASISWAAEDLNGSYDYRVRVSTVASGGPDPSLGVDVAQDPTGTASFWIMAVGAVQETPVAANSQLFSYNGDKAGGNGSTQLFTVPDNVTEVAVEMAGSKGHGAPGAAGGLGTTIRFRMVVVPGTIYAVDVGGHNTISQSWPGGWGAAIGGNGASGTGATGQGGGGATGLRLQGAAFVDSIAVAPAGGGATGNSGSSNGAGGDSGFYQGQDGTLGGGIIREQGYGATQFAPGPGGVAGGPAEAGDTDGQGYGGDCSPDTVGGGTTGSGGGGAGWHGGGGGSGLYAGGGGGAGYVDFDLVFDLEISDADRDDDGYVLFEWDDPLT